MDGRDHPVELYFRDYRQVDGLQVPFILETRVLPVPKTATGLRDVPVPPEKTIIDKVVLNPKFDESLFPKPSRTRQVARCRSPAIPGNPSLFRTGFFPPERCRRAASPGVAPAASAGRA